MIGLACLYRKDEHRIIYPRIISWLKRRVSNVKLRDSLFIYFHLKERTIVVAQWIVPCKTFIDVMNLGTSFSSFTPEVAKRLLNILRSPISGHELATLLKDRDRRRVLDKQDDNDEMVGYRSRHRTKIMETVPSLQGT